MKVTQPFPNFIQGVSQQPPALRLPSHSEELINAYASSEEGLTKRPHTEHVSKLGSTSFAPAKIHSFSKSVDEQGYVILKGDGTIAVKDFDGTSATVNMVAATTYINSVSNPITDFELITVADYTFIVNRTIVPALKADTYTDYSGGNLSSLVWVRTPQLDTPYTITLTGGTGVTATFNPGTTSANAQTIYIATQLKTQIDTFGTPAFTASTLGSVLSITRGANSYDISVADGRGNEAMVLLNRATGNPGNLPPNAPNGYQIEITGSEDTQWDNYWVEFDATKKVWLEIPKPGRQYKIDPATMPHIVKYVSPGVYSFEQIAWNDCTCGDTTTNPVPSFIGKAIYDMFFYRGRLGFITDKTVVMSEAGNLYNFWRTTCTALVDSDPIDVKVSMTDPAPLRWAVEYDDTVFFFTAKQQYYIEKNVEVLAPRTIAIRAPTKFEVDVTAQPVVVGDRIYYTRQRAIHSSLHDFYPKADAEGRLTFGSEEVTIHCPRYITGRVKQLKGTSEGTAIILLNDNEDNRCFVFQTAFKDRTRVQAALHRWEFDDANTPLTVEANGSALYFLMSRTDGVFLEKCDLSPKAVDQFMPIKLLLDHRLDETQVTRSYSSGTGKTTITLPFADTHAANPFVLYGRGISGPIINAGQLVSTITTSSSPYVVLTVDGDFTSEEFYVGKNYTFEKTFSPIILRDRTTGAPLTGGRLQVSRMFLNYGDTGYFRVLVTPASRDTYTYPLGAYQLGSGTTPLGEIPLLSGEFKFPVLANNLKVSIKVQSDAPFPLKLLNGDWEGQFGSQAVQAARRI
ncbi:hypothetical protein UFOVP823_30 [uncultured Caudovirales phage]|uniref:Tail tubular protein B n=1 Tax=uncultured Caudovirales phage TaxID=2100421 RepID=A0A6J5P7C0_9CAUD|nr:hypothetical protein UFOVP823_30 [uncultured Caudovirales phage]